MIQIYCLRYLALFVAIETSQQALGFSLSPKPTGRSWSSGNFQRGAPRANVALDANLITFDLDDTIFPVGPVVADANKALFRHLRSLGCETTPEEYVKTTKRIRSELAKDNKVITYTELRKRSIRTELKKYLPEETVTDSIVTESYDLWEGIRHKAAETHLYPGTVSMLQQLKTNHPDAVIAAITNGKGNPLEMESIKEFFDYCVSGEDDDVFPLRKPDEGIYKKALERFRALSEQRGGEPIDMNEQCWIHVGDDLGNDVGASSKCGAKAIWVDLGDEYNQTASKTTDPSQPQPVWSTATKEEIEKRKLMDEQAQQYVCKRVTSLEMLPADIDDITQAFLQELRKEQSTSSFFVN
jgi:putative hydrolase of the HAD superfamily